LGPEHFEPFRFVDLYQNQMMQTPARAIEAHERAETLLLEHLNADQAEQWRNDNSFDVVAQSGSTYKVDAQAGSVTDHEKGVWYCLQPDDEEVPSPDLALAHKLWLEADEEGFLRKANCFALNMETGQFWRILTDNSVPADGARAHLEQRLADAERELQNNLMHLQHQYERNIEDLHRRHMCVVRDIHEEFDRDQSVGRVRPEDCDIVFSDCHAGLGSRS